MKFTNYLNGNSVFKVLSINESRKIYAKNKNIIKLKLELKIKFGVKISALSC